MGVQVLYLILVVWVDWKTNRHGPGMYASGMTRRLSFLCVYVHPCPPLRVPCIFFHNLISFASPCCPFFLLSHPLPLSPALLLILFFSFDIHA